MKKHKTILITGGGSGIGKAIAHEIAQDGHDVILLGRDEEKLQTVLDHLPPKFHQILPADVRSVASLETAAKSLGNIQLDAIIVNAGIGGKNHFGSQDRWNDIINTNLTGAYLTVQTFLPYLKPKDESKPAHIIFTSSVLARLGVAGYTAYCASKAGIQGLMRSLAVELASKNILVNAICPGWVSTEMATDGIAELARDIGMTKAQFTEAAMKQVPTGRMSDPEEIAELVQYLIHQRSITGQSIDINGGSFLAG